MKGRCRDLIQKRLKKVVIVPIDDDDVGLSAAQGSRGGDPGEAAPDDDDAWLREVHARFLAPPAPQRKRGMLRK